MPRQLKTGKAPGPDQLKKYFGLDVGLTSKTLSVVFQYYTDTDKLQKIRNLANVVSILLKSEIKEINRFFL